MADKVAIMVLEVDLQCPRCYKKVKKLLCKFPQIRDQVYDEKGNRVTIRVVCCNPERLRDKLCCKGGGSIKSIEIKEPEKPKPPTPAQEKKKESEKPKPPPPEPEKKKEPEKPKPPPPEPAKKKEPEKPKPPPPEPEKKKPIEVVLKPDKPKEEPKPKNPDPPTPAPPPQPPVQPILNPEPFGYPPGYPIGVCCRECYEGYAGAGPCFHGGYGGGYGGRPVYDSYGGGRSCHSYTSRCDYFSEENASGCTIM